MAPVVEDDGRMLAESAAICEHICHRYADGRLTVAPSQPNYYDYLYWMHFNNNVMGLSFAGSVLKTGASGLVAETIGEVTERRMRQYYTYLDNRIGEVPYLAGSELTCADIQVVYRITTGVAFGARSIDDLPNATANTQRIVERPAYQKAMQIAGPNTVPPLLGGSD